MRCIPAPRPPARSSPRRPTICSWSKPTSPRSTPNAPPTSATRRRAGAGRRATTIDRRRGRTETRTLYATGRLRAHLARYTRFPAIGQVACLLATTEDRRSSGPHREARFLLTSLRPQQADPARLRALARGHWSIENGLHRVKDVILGADQSTIHQGQGPTVMALLREAAVSLLHRAGIRQISARLRHHSRHPAAAVALLLAPHPPDAQALGQALWVIYKPIV